MLPLSGGAAGKDSASADEQTLRLLRAGREVESAKAAAFGRSQAAILEHISTETGAAKSRQAALVEHKAKLLEDKEALTRGRVSKLPNNTHMHDARSIMGTINVLQSVGRVLPCRCFVFVCYFAFYRL